MHCFWDGEAKLGGIPGVIETEAGWLDGREVVHLRFDPSIVDWASLVRAAQVHGCAEQVYAPDASALQATPKALTRRARIYNTKDYRRASTSDQKRHLNSQS